MTRSAAFPEWHDLNRLTRHIIGSAMTVHSKLGPGLLESTYGTCLAYELTRRTLRVEREKPLPVTYDSIRVDHGYRVDLLVESAVIVELKTVSRLDPVHRQQLLTYLRLSGCRVGLLINFNVVMLRDGISRVIVSHR